LLMTYSRSTAIRAALLGAGFHVARGAGSGPKAETTVAYTAGPATCSTASSANARTARGFELLPPEWLRRWEASQAKYPFDVPADALDSFAEKIRRHPQFMS